LVTRLEAERTSGNYAVDLVISGPFDVQRIERRDLLQPYIPEIAAPLPSQFKTKSGVFSMPFRNLFALMYNSNLVAEKDLPSSLGELLDDKWKGKIGHAIPTGSNSFDTCSATLWYNNILTEDHLWKLRELARGIQRSTDVATFVAQGRLTFGIWGPTQTAYQLQKDKAPIHVKYLQNATVMFGAGMGLMKSSPNTDAAKLFMEWMYSPSGQRGVMAMTAMSTMPDAPVPPEYPKMPPYTLKDIPLDETIPVLEAFRIKTKAIWTQ
jgi:iron(III) transport system substrate-binding protein